ncbi:unnamed protein product [Camellia sinensis]
MAEQSFLDLKPKLRKIRETLLDFCLGPPASSLHLLSFTSLDKEPCPRGTRESKLVERKTSRIGNNIQETQMGCIARVGLRFHFRSQPPMVGQSFARCYKNDIGQTFYSVGDLMRYVNYAKGAEVSIYAPRILSSYTCFLIAELYSYNCWRIPRQKKTVRPNPPNVRKEAEKVAAGKQRSKGLIRDSNQSDEKRDNPEAASLPGELPKKVRHDKAPNLACVSDDEEAQFHLSNYYQ